MAHCDSPHSVCFVCFLVGVEDAFKEFLCLRNVTNINFEMIYSLLIPYNVVIVFYQWYWQTVPVNVPFENLN